MMVSLAISSEALIEGCQPQGHRNGLNHERHAGELDPLARVVVFARSANALQFGHVSVVEIRDARDSGSTIRAFWPRSFSGFFAIFSTRIGPRSLVRDQPAFSRGVALVFGVPPAVDRSGLIGRADDGQHIFARDAVAWASSFHTRQIDAYLAGKPADGRASGRLQRR